MMLRPHSWRFVTDDGGAFGSHARPPSVPAGQSRHRQRDKLRCAAYEARRNHARARTGLWQRYSPPCHQSEKSDAGGAGAGNRTAGAGAGTVVSAATLVAVLVGTDVDRGAPGPRVTDMVSRQAVRIALVDGGAAGL